MKTRFVMNGVLFVPLCDLTPQLRDALEISGHLIVKVENGPDSEVDLR